MTADSGTLSTPFFGAAASLARYFAGFAFSSDGQPSQQAQSLRPSTSTGTGGPIEPSFAPVTVQTFCSSTVRLAGWAEASRSRNIGISATGVLSVTVANMPGR